VVATPHRPLPSRATSGRRRGRDEARGGPLRESALFGNPADHRRGPVALRPPIARGLPFRECVLCGVRPPVHGVGRRFLSNWRSASASPEGPWRVARRSVLPSQTHRSRPSGGAPTPADDPHAPEDGQECGASETEAHGSGHPRHDTGSRRGRWLGGTGLRGRPGKQDATAPATSRGGRGREPLSRSPRRLGRARRLLRGDVDRRHGRGRREGETHGHDTGDHKPRPGEREPPCTPPQRYHHPSICPDSTRKRRVPPRALRPRPCAPAECPPPAPPAPSPSGATRTGGSGLGPADRLLPRRAVAGSARNDLLALSVAGEPSVRMRHARSLGDRQSGRAPAEPVAAAPETGAQRSGASGCRRRSSGCSPGPCRRAPSGAGRRRATAPEGRDTRRGSSPARRAGAGGCSPFPQSGGDHSAPRGGGARARGRDPGDPGGQRRAGEVGGAAAEAAVRGPCAGGGPAGLAASRRGGSGRAPSP